MISSCFVGYGFSDAASCAPVLRSTAGRVNGAAAVHGETHPGDKIILHEKEYRRGDVFRSSLALH
jgi:hypothetical protein